MNEQRIRELAEQASTHAEETVHYYMGQFDGLTWQAKILKARDLKFAELLVRECIDIVGAGGEFASRPKLVEKLQEHFGVEL